MPRALQICRLLMERYCHHAKQQGVMQVCKLLPGLQAQAFMHVDDISESDIAKHNIDHVWAQSSTHKQCAEAGSHGCRELAGQMA